MCGGRGTDRSRHKGSSWHDEGGTLGWAGPGCGKRRELGACMGDGRGGEYGVPAVRKRLCVSLALENQLSHHCFLVRVRPEGWGGVPRGMRHLLGQGVPLTSWGTVWCQICVLWPALTPIMFWKCFLGGGVPVLILPWSPPFLPAFPHSFPNLTGHDRHQNL